MDFFSQYYYYLDFFCGCSFLFFALSCFLSWRAKFGKLSYEWMILFGASFAIIKFYQMFSRGSLYTEDKISLILSIMLYVTMIFFSVSSQKTYLMFKPEKKFVKYFAVLCAFVCVASGFIFGIKWFNVSIFIFMWAPFSVMMCFSIYRMSKTDMYAKQNISFILVFFIIYCVVYLVSEAGMVFRFNIQLRAVCDALLSCIVFSIGAIVFKYFKISYERHVRIYDYMPVYWRYIPIGSILFIVLVGGLFFAMYLENYSRNNIESNSKAVVSNIVDTLTNKFNKADQISLALSYTPFILEAMSYPENADKSAVGRMLENYCKTFGIPMIFIVNNSGSIVFYSDLVKEQGILDLNLKYRPFFISAQNSKHGSVFAKSLNGTKQTYFSSVPVSHVRGGIAGALIIQDDIDEFVSKLKQYKNIYIVDENGIVFLSDNDDAYLSHLWPLLDDGENAKKSENENKKIFSAEVYNGETIVLDDELIYVTRQFINEAGWSVIYFSSLKPVQQFKVLSIAGVSGALIIVLLLFWSINQSNRILALALQHKAILNSAKSIMIVFTDVLGNIIVYGRGTEEILGYTREEFAKKGIENIIFDKDGNPATFEEVVTYSSSPSVEILCQRKDGSLVTILVSVLPQYSVDNKLIGYIFSGVDVTSTKEAEVELEHQIKFLQMLMDSMPVAVYYKDSEMHMIGCNKVFEDVMELSKDFVIGKMAEYFDVDAWNESKRTDVAVAENLSSIAYERIVKFRKSSERHLVYYKSAYKKIDGKFGGIIGVILDVTRERKMQKERDALQANLIQHNKLLSLGELAGSIAHELNNPLGVIFGFAQVLAKDPSINEQARKGIKNIYEAAERSRNIITNMLEFARSDTSKNQLVCINDIVESTLRIISKDFYKSGIEIERNLTKDNRSVTANPVQIQQVILNVLLNAKDAMPGGGKVTIKTDIKNKYFIMDITDTGLGIPKEIISKIFEPFFTTKGVGKGTGLGLSICYGIINAHKGEITVKNTAVNKGTAFSIKLPLNARK